ncbi:MAG: hypothetical protein DWQ11_10685 [Proteobacteria bacterium]|nr:MAG: hypothetical protein DWQ11_10685 [Pseudomonadota bacterium]
MRRQPDECARLRSAQTSQRKPAQWITLQLTGAFRGLRTYPVSDKLFDSFWQLRRRAPFDRKMPMDGSIFQPTLGLTHPPAQHHCQFTRVPASAGAGHIPTRTIDNSDTFSLPFVLSRVQTEAQERPHHTVDSVEANRQADTILAKAHNNFAA